MIWVVIILSCLVVLAVAGVRFGLLNYQSVLSQIPFVDNFVAIQAGGGTTESYEALKQENDSLKKQVQSLTQDAVVGKGSQSNSNAADSTGTSGEGKPGGSGNINGNPASDQAQQKVYKDLANYYANMEPASAEAILNNQDPQTVAAILYEMGKNQASDILAVMDPAQAAKLLKLMAGIDSQVEAQSSGLTTEE
jgi:flagellar motility protein MotE (MotC chaperone)